jgi:hypothetical protein
MIYLAPTVKPFFNDPGHFGCIFGIAKPNGGRMEALRAGCWWLLENNRFTGKFTEKAWFKALPRYQIFKDRCIGIVIPDQPFDSAGTLAEFWKYQHFPREWGYRVALVSQNGMRADDIPWDHIDTLFIGGDDHHKRGLEAQNLALSAKSRGKWVHVGRCNSGRAMLAHWTWADSADGTTLAIHPTQQLESIRSGVKAISNKASHQLILIDKVRKDD